MLPKKLEELTPEYIQSLEGKEVNESKYLDYKTKLWGKSKSEKKEMLKDISAFANSGGGDIVIGIKETKGLDEYSKKLEVVGIDDFDLDSEILSIESSLGDNLRPRLPKRVDFKRIDMPSCGAIFVIRIYRSWISPHMVTLDRSNKIYGRNNGGVILMDVDQMREAFTRPADIIDRIREWRRKRVFSIASREFPIVIPDSPHDYGNIVLHLIPIEAFALSDISDRLSGLGLENKIDTDLLKLIFPMGYNGDFNGGFKGHPNLDGHISYYIGGCIDETYPYLQLFRNGCFEAVLIDEVKVDKIKGGKFIDLRCLRDKMEKQLMRYLELMKRMELGSLVYLAISITNSKGVKIYFNSGSRRESMQTPIQKDIVMFPETKIVNIFQYKDPYMLLKDFYRYLYQSVGEYDVPDDFRV